MIRDQSGAPQSGALVAAVPREAAQTDALAGVAHTASDGSYLLPLPAGAYSVTVTAPGKQGGFEPNAIVVSTRATVVDFKLADGGITLSGQVADFSGHPVSSALVGLVRNTGEPGGVWWVRADSSGRYQAVVPAGEYGITGRADGYETGIALPQLPADRASRTLNLELEPSDYSRFAGGAVIESLRAASMPLATSDLAVPSLDDLAPLSRLVGRAHLVGLGEGTHGGHEMFRLKARIFRFLVEQMGFTILGLEGSWSDTLPVNEYVLSGKGDPVRAVSGVRFWTLDTEEVIEVVRWMRAYNADPRHTRKLQVVGFDMQYAPTAIAGAYAYVSKVDPAYAGRLDRLTNVLGDEFNADWFSYLPSELRQATVSDVGALLRFFDDNRATLVEKTGEKEWAAARRQAEVAAQAAQLGLGGEGAELTTRDKFMAENIRWTLDHAPPGTRMALWAHNAHVAKALVQATDAMGTLLHQRYGADYVALATCFGSGSFRAVGVSPERPLLPFDVPAPPAGTIEGTLGRVGLPLLGVNLRLLPPDSAAARWAHHPLRMRLLGAVYSESMEQSLVPGRLDELYDGLFYIDRMSASRYVGINTAPATPQKQPTNLDFEVDGAEPIPGWLVPRAARQAGFVGAIDPTQRFSRKRSVLLSRSGTVRMPGYGTLEQLINATPFQGKRVRLRAAVRVEAKHPLDRAQLFVQGENEAGDIVSFRNMFDHPIRSPQWATYDVTVDVTADTKLLRYGVAVSEEARVWVDSFAVDPIGDAPGEKR